jgi:hypothetical protein
MLPVQRFGGGLLDTIKVGVPVSQGQHEKLLKLVSSGDQWQWVQFQPQSGELRFLRLKGSAEVDHNSYHRNINWHLPDHYRADEAFLTVELSLPKFTYGHNIHLLYEWVNSLKDLKKQFEKRLSCRFRDVSEWRIRRVDVCYAWRCPSQETAQGLLDSLKRLRYPRKEPVIYPDSITFTGSTYSFKVYLKLPEFKAHDMKELIKAKASLEWVNHLEKLATGVLRVEATLRQKYLDKKGIKTVGDLAKPVHWIEWEDRDEIEDFKAKAEMYAKLSSSMASVSLSKDNACEKNYSPVQTLIDGKTYVAKPVHIEVNLEINNFTYDFPGGEFTYRKLDEPTIILQYFLTKFIGENKGMDEAGQVKAKLMEKYGAAKGIRLLGFWLHVQKFSAEDAKDLYSRRVFFRNKADLKAAEVSLLEPVKRVKIDEQFVESFQFTVPSVHVTNQFDDFKDSGNLLNEKPDDVKT